MEVPLFRGRYLLPKAPWALCSRQDSLFSNQVSLLKLWITFPLPTEVVWTGVLESSENRSADFPSKPLCLPGFFKISERTLIRTTLRGARATFILGQLPVWNILQIGGRKLIAPLDHWGLAPEISVFNSYSLTRWLLWFPSLKWENQGSERLRSFAKSHS